MENELHILIKDQHKVKKYEYCMISAKAVFFTLNLSNTSPGPAAQQKAELSLLAKAGSRNSRDIILSVI